MKARLTVNEYNLQSIIHTNKQLWRICAAMRSAFSFSFSFWIVLQIGCQPAIHAPTDHESGRIHQNSGGLEAEPLEICMHNPSSVLSLIFTDNRHLCSGSNDGVVKLFDLHASNKQISSFHACDHVAGVNFLPSTNKILTASVSVLNISNYPRFSDVNDYYRASPYVFLTFSNGIAIFQDPDRGLLLLNTANKEVRRVSPPDGNLGSVNTAAYSAKGKFLVAGGAAGVLSRLDLDAKPATLKFNYNIGFPILCVTVSSDEDTLAVTAGDKVIRLLNTVDGTVIKKLSIESDGVDQLLLFTKDGKILISIEPVGDNCQPSLIRFWDVKNGTEICSPLVGHKYRIKCACLSPDNLLLATGSLDGSILVWKLPDRKNKSE